MQEAVNEYFNNYFDGNLTEDTTDAEIMGAVEDLVLLTEAVCDTLGIDLSEGIGSIVGGRPGSVARGPTKDPEDARNSPQSLRSRRVTRDLAKSYASTLKPNPKAKTGNVGGAPVVRKQQPKSPLQASTWYPKDNVIVENVDGKYKARK